MNSFNVDVLRTRGLTNRSDRDFAKCAIAVSRAGGMWLKFIAAVATEQDPAVGLSFWYHATCGHRKRVGDISGDLGTRTR